LALGDQLLPAAAGGRPRQDAAPWDLEGNKYLDFFGGILTVFRGSLQPEDHQQSERAGQPATGTLRRCIPTNTSWRWRRRSRRSRRETCSRAFSPTPARKPTKPPFCSHECPPAALTWVALRHAYSGGSALAKAVTAHAPYRKGGVISVGISHAVNPYCYPAAALENIRMRSGLRGRRGNLIQTGTSGQHRGVHRRTDSGRRWVHHAPKEYFKIVFKIVKQYGALFIADEVQTGWGRHRKEMVRHRAVGSHSGMITSAKAWPMGCRSA